MKRLRQSVMKDFRACPRKYEIRHERGIEPVRRSHALRFGSLFHLGLEHWWRSAASYPAHHADWLEAGLLAITTAPTDGSPAEEYDVEKARVLLCGYHARWVVDGMHTWQGQPIHVHGAEVPFTGPLVNPATGKASKTFTHDGTIDAICEIGGRFYAMEHKTSGEDFSPGSEYWQRLRLDTQIGHYLAGARHLGYELDGVLYDVIGKPALAPLLATPIEKRKYRTTDGALYANQRGHDETPEEYALRLSDFVAANPDQCYARSILVRLERDEREAAIDAWQTAEEIRDAVRLNRFPRNPMSCRLYNHTCDYWPACAGETSLDDEMRYRKVEA